MTRNELIDLKVAKKKYIRAKGHGSPFFYLEAELMDLMLIENEIEPLKL